MAGSLMQLIAYGSYDIYIMDNGGYQFSHVDWDFEFDEEYSPLTILQSLCPLSNKYISNDYCICSSCDAKMDFDALVDRLSRQDYPHFCPKCNVRWTNFTKYHK
jgi:hypothetical protein